MKKLTAEQLKQMIQKEIRIRLQEKKATVKESAEDFVPGADNKLSAYVEKCDKAMADCRVKLKDLMDEGEELVRLNLFKDATVGERNRLILMYIGVMKKVHNLMASSIEALKRGF